MTRQEAVERARELIERCDWAMEHCNPKMRWPSLLLGGEDVLFLRLMLAALIEEQQ